MKGHKNGRTVEVALAGGEKASAGAEGTGKVIQGEYG